jgi:hypothetical protein
MKVGSALAWEVRASKATNSKIYQQSGPNLEWMLRKIELTIGNDLDSDQLGNRQDVRRRNSKEESQGVQDVSEDELQRKRVGSASGDTPELTDPSKKSIESVHGTDDTKHVTEDQSGDPQSEPSSVGERVKQVVTVILVVTLGDLDVAESLGDLGLWDGQLG